MVLERRWAPLSLAAVVIAAAFGCAPARLADNGNNFRIKVGPDETTVHPETQSLSKSEKDEAYWILVKADGSLDSSRILYIEFDKQEVFPQSKPVPGPGGKPRYRVDCVGGFCQSGAIGPDAKEGMTYVYWQKIATPDGAEHAADGRIIINH
jgi:hypothetical protein